MNYHMLNLDHIRFMYNMPSSEFVYNVFSAKARVIEIGIWSVDTRVVRVMGGTKP